MRDLIYRAWCAFTADPEALFLIGSVLLIVIIAAAIAEAACEERKNEK